MAKDARISEQEFGLNLNLDDSLKKMTPGDATFMLNCVSGISKEGNIGAVENERGNKLVSFALPDGDNRVIGTAIDIQHNAVIYFVQNSGDGDCILRYNIDLNSITRILYEEPILNFKTITSDRKGYITHANVVDDLLLWSDGVQEARKINIDKAIAFSLSGGNDPNGYSQLTEETITAIKRPPRYSPTTRIYTSPLRDTNFLAQRSFNFAYRYKYDDNERSVFSPYSRAVYPPFDPYVADDVHFVNTIGMYEGDMAGTVGAPIQPRKTSNKQPFSANPSAYNAIDIGVILGLDLVSEIEVLVRSGEFGVWTVFDTIDNKLLVTSESDGGSGLIPGSEYTITFFNDKTGITVSDESALKTMDFFPINPKTQEFTHLNLMVYGNYLDGYEIVPPAELDMTVQANVREFHPFQWNFTFYDEGDPEYSKPNPAFLDLLTQPVADVNEWFFPEEYQVVEGRLIMIATFYGNWSAVYVPNNSVGNKRLRNYPWAWYRCTDLDAIDYAHFKDNFTLALNNQGYFTTHDGSTFVISPALSQDTLATVGLNASIYEGNMEGTGDERNLWQHRTFKQGAYHQIGIVYYDEWGRHGPAQTQHNEGIDFGSRVYVPMWGEIPDNQQAVDTNGYFYDLFITVGHNPPEWAHYYQIVYTGSINIDDFLQYPYRQPDEREDDPDAGLITLSFDTRNRISFTNWTDFLNLNDRVRRGYTFEVDDFVRGVKRETRFSAVQGDFEYNLNLLADSVKSERINFVDLDFLEETPTSSAGFFDNLGSNSGGLLQPWSPVDASWRFLTDNTPTVIWNILAEDNYTSPTFISYTAYLQVPENESVGATYTLELQLDGIGVIPGTTVVHEILVASPDSVTFGVTEPFQIPDGFIPLAGQTISLVVNGNVIVPEALNTYINFVEGGIKQEVNRAVTLIEQYKASQEEELLVFRECGLVGDVINPGDPKPNNRLHAAPKNLPATANPFNQTTELPMRFKFEDGDAWTKVRPYGYLYDEAISAGNHPQYNENFWEAIDSSIIVSTILEDPYFSDYWPSNFDGFGRLFGEDNDFKQVNQVNGLKYTGTYLQGTQINNLNAVDFDSVGFTDIADGEIFAIRQVGFTLKCIQDARVTSFYLGRETVANPQGTQDLVLSDSVLSDANPSELDFGTRYPESVIRHDRDLYFFDVNYGKVIRDSANGMVPISDYKAAILFKALSEQLNVKVPPGSVTFISHFCRGVWNDDLNSYVFVYSILGSGGDIPKLDPFTISFQEGANRWKSYHSYIPENVAFLGRTFVSFQEGQIYLHNSDEVVRGDFYGEQYPSRIVVPTNLQPDDVKTFDAIAIQTSRKPSRVIISTPPNEFYKEGMYSRLLEPNFRWIEGNLYSSFKKDLYTPGMEGRSDIDKLNNGRELRGNVARITVEFSPGEKVVTTRVIVALDHSKKSGRQ
jgi:hypothetical protein